MFLGVGQGVSQVPALDVLDTVANGWGIPAALGPVTHSMGCDLGAFARP